jgi:hypothetical protein
MLKMDQKYVPNNAALYRMLFIHSFLHAVLVIDVAGSFILSIYRNRKVLSCTCKACEYLFSISDKTCLYLTFLPNFALFCPYEVTQGYLGLMGATAFYTHTRGLFVQTSR